MDGPYLFYKDGKCTTISVDIIKNTKKNVSNITVNNPDGTSFIVPIVETKTEEKSIYEMPDKLIALSDIEGNYYSYVNTLKNNHIIDDDFNWIFGKGHLVLVGDMFDRGEYVTQILWLTYKIEQESEKSGGKVHFILGNHDEMNINGDVRYVAEKYKLLADKMNLSVGELFGLNTEIGKWIRHKNIIEKIGDHIFCHGGISDSLTKFGLNIQEMNDIARANFDIEEESEDAKLLFGRFGLIWYRGLVRDYKYYNKISEDELDKVLAYFDSRKVIVGHCIVDDISLDFGGKVIRIDVDHYETKSRGLLIENGKYYKIMEDGNKIKLE